LWGRLDDPNQIESVQQIRFYAHGLSAAMGDELSALISDRI
jgi:hypothetical protein